MRRKKKLFPHHEFPLRRILRREVQNGKRVVVMECNHAAVGKPLSRFSRFYPCAICHGVVEKARMARARAA